MLGSYGVFLLALYLLASSITLLQVAANPYVAVIGAPETASSRLNLVQALDSRRNHGGAAVRRHLIFARSSSGTAESTDLVLTAQQRAADVQAVELPYLIIAGYSGTALAYSVWSVRLRNRRGEPACRAGQRAKHSSAPQIIGLRRACDLPVLVSEIGIGSTLVNFIRCRPSGR